MSKYRRGILYFMRVFYILGILSIFYAFWQNAYEEAAFFDAGNYVVMLSYTIFVVLFMKVYRGTWVGIQRLGSLLYSSALALTISDCLMYLVLCLIAREMLPPWGMVFALLAQYTLALVACWSMNTVYLSLRKPSRVIAIYAPNEADDLTLSKMRSIRERFDIVGVIDASQSIERICEAAAAHDAVLFGSMPQETRQVLFNRLYRAGKRIHVIPSAMDIALNSAMQTQIYDTQVLLCKNRELSPEQRAVKRTVDIVLSAIALAVSSPVMLIIAALIKLQDGGPVFYRQKRLTRNGKVFNVIKFRSMTVNADSGLRKEHLRVVTNDLRVTRVGKVIRLLHMDELPQFINILLGEMSLVGPRPERVEHYDLYLKELQEFDMRLRVKAGLTGYAQIYGRYNTTPRDKLNMDLFYIENYSIMQDFKLMLLTVKILFKKETSQAFSKDDAPEMLVYADTAEGHILLELNSEKRSV